MRASSSGDRTTAASHSPSNSSARADIYGKNSAKTESRRRTHRLTGKDFAEATATLYPSLSGPRPT